MQTGETAALAVVRAAALTYIDEVAPSAIVSASWSGQPVSPHATSTGKVLLAWSTEEELARLMPRRLKRYTATTITDRAGLRADLDADPRTGIRHLSRRVRGVCLGRLGSGARPHGSAPRRY